VFKSPAKSKASIEKESAFQRIIKLASIKEQASSKLFDRLVREGYPDDEVGAAIERAIDCGFVNDERFAECYLRSHRAQGKGMSGMLKDLDSLGIDVYASEYLHDLVSEYEQEEERRAYELITSRPPHSKNPRDAAYRKLISKGYSSQVASTVARKWHEGLELDAW